MTIWATSKTGKAEEGKIGQQTRRKKENSQEKFWKKAGPKLLVLKTNKTIKNEKPPEEKDTNSE